MNIQEALSQNSKLCPLTKEKCYHELCMMYANEKEDCAIVWAIWEIKEQLKSIAESLGSFEYEK